MKGHAMRLHHKGKRPLLLMTLLLVIACTPALKSGPIRGPSTYYRSMDLETGGFRRSYRLHVPAGYDGKTTLPLVLVVHGAFDTARGMEEKTGFSQLADREQLIVLYANGIGLFGYLQHWNAGHCCGKAAQDGIDDVGYLAAAIDDAASMLPVDRRRIYMVGFSNGGMMTYRFAAQRGEMLAAAAVLAGSIGGRPDDRSPLWRIPEPATPVPLLVMHGLDDDHVPFEGGHPTYRKSRRTYLSVMDSVQFWVRHDGCKEPPLHSVIAGGAVRIQTWPCCKDGAAVSLYEIAGWGHTWPGPYFTADLPADDPLHNFDAAKIIWNFFKSCVKGRNEDPCTRTGMFR